jgi:hypothetical protein
MILVLSEELGWLGRMLSGDIVEGVGRDVVGLALSNQRVVLKKILHLGWIKVGSLLNELLGLTPIGRLVTKLTVREDVVTYSETSSNWMSSTFRLCFAAVSNSSPAQSIGPRIGLVMSSTTMFSSYQ